MLYLSRKIGESIVINNNIEISVVEVKGKTVKIGCVFPQSASILRKELYEKIRAENLQARNYEQDATDILSALEGFNHLNENEENDE